MGDLNANVGSKNKDDMEVEADVIRPFRLGERSDPGEWLINRPIRNRPSAFRHQYSF